MNLKSSKLIRSILVLYFTLPLTRTHSAEQSFEYPELSMVPRASEMIASEASHEKENSIQRNLSFLFPATMTLISGATLIGGADLPETDPKYSVSKIASWVGLGTGVAWWAAHFAFLDSMEFYSEGVTEISKLPSRSQREQLIRERKAEEAVQKAASIGRKLKWISIGTNFAASALMASSANKNSFSFYFAAASVLTSFTPLLFPHRWETVGCLYQDYKKRIYGPVVGTTLFMNPTDASILPGLALNFQF